MTNQHPITPPPELVQQWRKQMPAGIFDGYKYPEREKALCLVAAQWGAEQELEECWRWMRDEGYRETAQLLHSARRPKPPSLKEQALEALKDIECEYVIGVTTSTIRRALEALPE
jgi:hypothetical protein